MNPHDAVVPRRNHRAGVQRHRRREHTSKLVIRVIAADLAAPRCGKERRIVALAKCALKRIRKREILLLLRVQRVAIQIGQRVIQFAAGQFFTDREHIPIPPAACSAVFRPTMASFFLAMIISCSPMRGKRKIARLYSLFLLSRLMQSHPRKKTAPAVSHRRANV
ncbi:hypothetical protein SDC9_172242 [bioreactor metagenome]|uniref:Uncharacterized protein n=1 Tax=bioreactor metagenome TaxID=1076179 RepID=A0A645GD58_9ZZZZ